jgi:hypothetical protein
MVLSQSVAPSAILPRSSTRFNWRCGTGGSRSSQGDARPHCRTVRSRPLLCSPPRDHHACDAARWDGVRIDLSPRIPGGRRPNPAPTRGNARAGRRRWRRSRRMQQPTTTTVFTEAALHPAYPIKRRLRREHGRPKASTQEEPPPWPIKE